MYYLSKFGTNCFCLSLRPSSDQEATATWLQRNPENTFQGINTQEVNTNKDIILNVYIAGMIKSEKQRHFWQLQNLASKVVLKTYYYTGTMIDRSAGCLPDSGSSSSSLTTLTDRCVWLQDYKTMQHNLLKQFWNKTMNVVY